MGSILPCLYVEYQIKKLLVVCPNPIGFYKDSKQLIYSNFTAMLCLEINVMCEYILENVISIQCLPCFIIPRI